MYVCICNAVTDSDIRNAVNEGVVNMRQLGLATGCGTTCGSCAEMAAEILQHSLTATRESRRFLPDLQMA